METPEGYESIRVGDARAFATDEDRGWIVDLLSSHGSLYAGASRARNVRVLEGRKPVYALQTEAGGRVVRRYHRGGAVAPLLGDRHLRVGQPRPVREAEASQAARRRGIPTPRVVGGAVYPSGIFYRADLVTAFLPGTVELAEVLFDPRRRGVSGSIDRREALAETGSLIRRMALAGVHHPDMNARNVLLDWKGGAPEGYVLDLDRCRIHDDGGASVADSMHARLLRSIRKLGRKTGLEVPPGDLKALKAGVEGA